MKCFLPLLLPLALTIGCDRPSPPPPASVLPTAVPAGHSVIRGHVRYNGPVPPGSSIAVNDNNCGCSSVTAQPILVDSNGGLQNAVLSLDFQPCGDGVSASTQLLDQVHCNYQPHVVVLQVGQTLMIRSSDATMHNVHFQPVLNDPHNFSMSTAGEQVPVRFTQAEFIPLRCDVHPWMSAWVAVFDHPFFTVSDERGAFRIEHVPAGNYTLRVWHEALGKMESKVQCSDTAAADVDLVFKPAAAAR